jgi:hypothetical protein
MIAVYEQTHQVYFPMQDVDRRPLLRRAIVCLPDRPVLHGETSFSHLFVETEYEQTPLE